MDSIPLIDFKSVIGTQYSEHPSEWTTLAENIRKIFGEGIGFMQIINHGIPQNIVISRIILCMGLKNIV